MPKRLPPRSHPRQFKPNHIVTQQGHNPPNRPNKLRTAFPSPKHRLRKVQLLNQIRQQLRQQLARRPTRHLPSKREVLALRGRLYLQIVNTNAVLLREAFHGLRVRTLRRPAHNLFAIGLPHDQPISPQHEPPPRPIGPRHRPAQLMPIEHSLKILTQLLQRRRNHPIRNLLGAHFEKER